jgi:hypothetical protein
VKIVAELDEFLKLISPEARRKIIGGKSNEEIWEELKSTEEHRTKVIDWLDAGITDEIAKGFKGVTARLQTSKIQDAYRTSKSAVMKKCINKRESSPCPIDEVEIYKYFKQAWKPTERAFYEAEPDSPFYLHRKLPDENVLEAMKDYMLSEDNIRDVIMSRDKLSASGNDGISYRIMKARDPEAVKFMICIIKVTIRCDRVMDSWKEARKVLIYKKGDRKDLKNWRPITITIMITITITITNCISRIYMCLMTRALQQMNLQHGIYVDAQNGFIKKTNRCSEHGILLNELF